MDWTSAPLDPLGLDAVGGLVHPHWGRVSAALARERVRVEAAALAAAEPRVKRALDSRERIGATTDATRVFPYLELVLEGAGVARSPGTDAALADLRAYHDRHNLWESVPPEVIPALTPVRTALDSQEEGVEKPDPRIFEIALARCGARPEATVHVGDFYHVDVEGARAAGLRAVLLDAAGLYSGFDCPRVPSLGALAEALTEHR